MRKIDSLLSTRTCIDDKWVIARPMSMSGLGGLIQRIKDAWKVVTGEADAIKFYKQ